MRKGECEKGMRKGDIVGSQGRPTIMTSEGHLIADAWLLASRDLGIEVITPFLLPNSNAEAAEYVAFVLDFGSPKGMLLLEAIDSQRIAFADAEGYGYSCLNVAS